MKTEKNWKRKLLSLFVMATICWGGGILTSCGGDDGDEEISIPTSAKVTEISVTPKNLTVAKKATFNAAKFTITATKSSGTTDTIPGDDSRLSYTLKLTDSETSKELKNGDELTADGTITVTYNGGEKPTAEITLTVIDVEIKGAPESLPSGSISSDFSSITIKQGETQISNPTFKWIDSDGKEATVANAGETYTLQATFTVDSDSEEITVDVVTLKAKISNTTSEETDENSVKYYALSSTAEEKLQEKDGAIDIAENGGANGTVALLPNSTLLWENPLAGKTDVSAVTISFELYANTTGTYSGVLGFYDKTTAGFLWITDTQWFLNSNANVDMTAENFSYTDAVSIGATNAAWQNITIVADASSVTTYHNGVKVGDSLTALQGKKTAIGALVSFLTNADTAYISAGNGVAFWNYAGIEGSALANIRVYPVALTEAQVQKVYKETFNPTAAKLEITGNTTTFATKSSLALNDDAVVTVTDSNGSKFTVPTNSVVLSAKKDSTTVENGKELSEEGTYTVTAKYTATENDAFTGEISTKFDITVRNIDHIKAEFTSGATTTYYTDGTHVPQLITDGIIVKSYATANATEGTELALNEVTFSALTTTSGEQTITVTYGEGESALKDDSSLKVTVSNIAEATDAGWRGSLGLTWGNVASGQNVAVKAGKQIQTTFTICGTGDYNWTIAPDTYLCNTASAHDTNDRYLYVRLDNFGEGTSYAKATHEATWSNGISDAKEFYKGATVTITVKNWGDNTADVVYSATKDSTTATQSYTGIPVKASALWMNITQGAGSAITFNQANISGISVTTSPTKETYVAGDSIDLAGLVLSVTYNGESATTVTYSDAIAACFSATTAEANKTTSTLTYGGKTAEISNLTVTGVTSIHVKTAPTITSYTLVNTDKVAFDPTGLVVTANSESGDVIDNKNLTFSDITKADSDGTNANFEVTITYGTGTDAKTTTQKVSVTTETVNITATSSNAFENKAVAAGGKLIATYVQTSKGEQNWNTCYPVISATGYSSPENLYCRTDHWVNEISGDNSPATFSDTSDWDWGAYSQFMVGATGVCVISNKGASNGLSVRMDFVNGNTTHYQAYTFTDRGADSVNVTMYADGCTATFGTGSDASASSGTGN